MTATNNLEINGNLSNYSLAELLTEISLARLNGSLRLSCESQKTVFYFDAGEVVFAVSNARAFRLFEMLLRENKIDRERLLEITDFTNDFLLGRNLVKNNLFSKPEVDRLFTEQIEEILKNAFGWLEGEWIFSPLVRIKGDIRFSIRSNQLAMEHARNLSNEAISARLKDPRVIFAVKPSMPIHINLSPQESFVFSRLDAFGLSVETIKTVSGLPESETLKVVYTLWLGGFLKRQNANFAFSERQTSEILSTNFSLVKGQKSTTFSEPVPLSRKSTDAAEPEAPIVEIEEINEEISLDDYLAQVENAGNYYEILAVESNADPTKIKMSYFSMAKRFHPDLFHKEADAQLQQRVQQAFSQLAQAYDTLRHEKSREVYNFKVRKELELKDKRAKTNGGANNEANPDLRKQFEQASDNFDQGYNLLLDEQFETAIPFLARAVHFAGDNARFRAFYGKALSFDNKQRHKAETELQAAVTLDQNNPEYRLMLVEFFMQINLLKRAEGELTRLLTVSPNNSEAKILLDSLLKK